MSEEPEPSVKPRLLTIREHLEAKGTKEPLTTIAQFVSHIHETCERWQQLDWKDREADELDVLNPARIVGQVWFRGQSNVTQGLRPGLYRKSTWKYLKKNESSPRPRA